MGWALLLCLLLTGCARTVTTQDALGTELKISFTTRANVDFSAVDYYVLISKSVSPLAPNQTRYFTAPGQAYDISKLESDGRSLPYLYTHFFSTWDDYIKANSFSSAPAFHGPFSASTVTANHFSFTQDSKFNPVFSGSGTQYEMQFLMSLFTANSGNANNAVFIKFVSVDRVTGRVLDILETQSIQLVSNATLGSQRTEDPTVTNGSADFVQWNARVF